MAKDPLKGRLQGKRVQKIGDDGHDHDPDEVAIKGPKVRYVFKVPKKIPLKGFLVGKTTSEYRFKPGRIYFRTRNHLYDTQYRSLDEVLERLDDDRFARAHASVIANLSEVHWLPKRGEKMQLGYAVLDGRDDIVVAERRRKNFRRPFSRKKS